MYDDGFMLQQHSCEGVVMRKIWKLTFIWLAWVFRKSLSSLVRIVECDKLELKMLKFRKIEGNPIYEI